MSLWRKWVRQPQDVFLRRALFQVHLWTGIALGLYLLVICFSGSILVYRSELSRTFQPIPRIITGSGDVMTDEALRSAVSRAYPDYEIADFYRPPKNPNQAVEVTVQRGDALKQRLFHPYTGEDLGYTLPAGYRFTQWLLVLHDNLLLDETGLTLNAYGGLLLAILSITGVVIWWPGSRGWRKSLVIDTKANWKRLNWTLHSALGFWFLAFILMWGISGLYLAKAEVFTNAADYFEPIDNYEPETRWADKVFYFLTYAHFGRFGNRVPGCGSICDQGFKALWAVLGLIPAAMFVTGAIMWWNRVLRPATRRSENVLAQGRMQPAQK